jgi:hypothetical protein
MRETRAVKSEVSRKSEQRHGKQTLEGQAGGKDVA